MWGITVKVIGKYIRIIEHKSNTAFIIFWIIQPHMIEMFILCLLVSLSDHCISCKFGPGRVYIKPVEIILHSEVLNYYSGGSEMH